MVKCIWEDSLCLFNLYWNRVLIVQNMYLSAPLSPSTQALLDGPEVRGFHLLALKSSTSAFSPEDSILVGSKPSCSSEPSGEALKMQIQTPKQVTCQSPDGWARGGGLSHSVRSDSATPWTAARQASLSITNSRSLLELMSIESVRPSSHLILCRPQIIHNLLIQTKYQVFA